MVVKTIVCLAISYKPGGWCMAGREIVNSGWDGWIRPVSARETREVNYEECRYGNGHIPDLLDVVDVPVLRAEPIRHQRENFVIDAGHWIRRGWKEWDDLRDHLERPDSLWINRDSTKDGMHDCVSREDAARITHSLLLIEPDEFAVAVGTSSREDKRTFRACFRYNRTVHNLSVTDPVVRSAFRNREPGSYPLPDVYLCVSLTEAYKGDGRCHKLVAAVIPKRPYR